MEVGQVEDAGHRGPRAQPECGLGGGDGVSECGGTIVGRTPVCVSLRSMIRVNYSERIECVYGVNGGMGGCMNEWNIDMKGNEMK